MKLNWELRVSTYYAKTPDWEYMVKISNPGWALYQRHSGDSRWEKRNTYLTAVAAMNSVG